MVTGKGLNDAFGEKFPKWVIIIAAFALLIANTITVGADLSGMADAANMLTGLNSFAYVVLFSVAITFATIWFGCAWPHRAIPALRLCLQIDRAGTVPFGELVFLRFCFFTVLFGLCLPFYDSTSSSQRFTGQILRLFLFTA